MRPGFESVARPASPSSAATVSLLASEATPGGRASPPASNFSGAGGSNSALSGMGRPRTSLAHLTQPPVGINDGGSIPLVVPDDVRFNPTNPAECLPAHRTTAEAPVLDPRMALAISGIASAGPGGLGTTRASNGYGPRVL